MSDATIRTPGVFGGFLAATVGAAVRDRLDLIRAKAKRKAKAAGRRPRAWKPPPGTPLDLIGRLDDAPRPPRLGTPTLSAYYRLNQS